MTHTEEPGGQGVLVVRRPPDEIPYHTPTGFPWMASPVGGPPSSILVPSTQTHMRWGSFHLRGGILEG